MTNDIVVPAGHFCITTYGQITAETVASYAETRHLFAKNGLDNVNWNIVSGNLVDKARNEAVMHLLADRQAGWLMFFDADMQWAPNAPLLLLQTAYKDCAWADIVGGYCNLRNEPHLPTIDTGTGTWEPTEPNIGPLEVMRTGSACILIKRHVYERMKSPWYGVRPAPQPLDMLAEVDNFANQKFDGFNPLREHPAWAQLERCAAEHAAQRPDDWSAVGEDSNFCDKAKALGFRIVVNTDAITHHVTKKVVTPNDHVEAMKKLQQNEALVSGVVV